MGHFKRRQVAAAAGAGITGFRGVFLGWVEDSAPSEHNVCWTHQDGEAVFVGKLVVAGPTEITDICYRGSLGCAVSLDGPEVAVWGRHSEFVFAKDSECENITSVAPHVPTMEDKLEEPVLFHLREDECGP